MGNVGEMTPGLMWMSLVVLSNFAEMVRGKNLNEGRKKSFSEYTISGSSILKRSK